MAFNRCSPLVLAGLAALSLFNVVEDFLISCDGSPPLVAAGDGSGLFDRLGGWIVELDVGHSDGLDAPEMNEATRWGGG